MDLDNRNGPADFDPRFAPPGATGYAPPARAAGPNPAVLIGGAVVVLVVIVGGLLARSGSGDSGPMTYKVEAGPGFRIEIPSDFSPQPLVPPSPYAKYIRGNPESLVSTVVYVFAKEELPGPVSIDKLFEVFAEMLSQTAEVEAMSETTMVRVDVHRSLQQVTQWKARGHSKTSLHTVLEDDDHFYLIEVTSPRGDWSTWEPRAKTITASFVLTNAD